MTIRDGSVIQDMKLHGKQLQITGDYPGPFQSCARALHTLLGSIKRHALQSTRFDARPKL
jgi:hypothetical protein